MPAAGSSHRPRELNDFIRGVNAGGGINGERLPLVSDSARFNDSFNSLDVRFSRPFAAGPDAGRCRWSSCSTCST